MAHFFGVVWLPSVFGLWKESAVMERQKHQGQLGKHYSPVFSTCHFDMLILGALALLERCSLLLWSFVLVFWFCLMVWRLCALNKKCHLIHHKGAAVFPFDSHQ